jgi:hypothetical protein
METLEQMNTFMSEAIKSKELMALVCSYSYKLLNILIHIRDQQDL